jgi:hypothetical protein
VTGQASAATKLYADSNVGNLAGNRKRIKFVTTPKCKAENRKQKSKKLGQTKIKNEGQKWLAGIPQSRDARPTKDIEARFCLTARKDWS